MGAGDVAWPGTVSPATTMRSLFDPLLPPGIAVAATRVEIEATLFPEEEIAVSRAVEGRRREFATGRACARQALAQLGLPPRPIGVATTGAPRWPEGVVGSITHCHCCRAAAVGWETDFGAVGIDAEPNHRLPGGTLRAISLPIELEAKAAAAAGTLHLLGPLAVQRQGVGLQGVVPPHPSKARVRGRGDRFRSKRRELLRAAPQARAGKGGSSACSPGSVGGRLGDWWRRRSHSQLPIAWNGGDTRRTLDDRSKPIPDRYLITSALPGADGVEHLGDLVGSTLPADTYARFLRARGESVLFVCATDDHGSPAELAAAEAHLGEELGLSFDVLADAVRRPRPRNRRSTSRNASTTEGFLEARSTRDPGAGDSRHLFLLQSKLAGQLRAWLDQQDDWPPPVRLVALEWLDRGLEDRSITRDLSRGVPVDRDGYEGKVYCDWFAAPIAYIGATREWADARGEPGARRRWWRRSEEVRHVQFMARDSVLRHAVCFPCTLLGSGEAWKVVDSIKAFNPLTYQGDKRSTGEGGELSLGQALELLPADCWRYYLLANAPEASDARFSWESLAVAVNEDLAGAFGGFVDRSLHFAERHLEGDVARAGEPGPAEAELLRELDPRLAAYTARMEALEFRSAIAELRAIWDCGNEYLDRKQPWAATEREPSDAARTARFCVELVYLFSRLAAPVIPFTAGRVLDALGVPAPARCWPSGFRFGESPLGHHISIPSVLFRKIGENDVARWRARFGGCESVDHEARLRVLEAQAPGRDRREYHCEEEQHRQR